MQLPQHAQRKLRDLQMSVEDGHARANLMLRRVKEQHETVERLRHDAVTAPDQRFESEIADAETELVRMQNLQQSRFEQFQATQSLLTNLREWIRQTPDDMPFVPVPKRMLGVDDPQAHVAQLRQAIEQKSPSYSASPPLPLHATLRESKHAASSINSRDWARQRSAVIAVASTFLAGMIAVCRKVR